MFKARQNTPAEAAPVTRYEFDAFKRVVALALMAAEEAAKYPGVTGGVSSTHRRLEKIAAGATPELFALDTAEVRELRGFLALLKQARAGECQREAEEIRARDNLRNNPWLPDGTYGRRIV